MTSHLLRAACALTLLLSACLRLSAADPAPTQAQIEAARRQQLQAQQKGDFTMADRFAKEVAALEARLGTTAAAAAAAAPAVPAAPVSSFFSAPSGAAASPPAGSSSVFSPPAMPGTALTTPAFTPPPAAPAPRYTPPALTNPVPAPKSTSVTGATTFTPSAPAGTTATFTPTTPATRPTTSTSPSSTAALTAAALLLAEEPRPADVPPAVLELRAAQAELSRLEEFRMAESLTTRRGGSLTADPLRAAPGGVSPPSALMTPPSPTAFPSTISPSVTPSVNLASGSDDLRRKLDDLTRRKSELQLEAERLSKDSADWEARYNAAKAELARLEAENKSRDRLQTIRDEIARLDTDATHLMQDIEASRAEQDRRARELLSGSSPMAMTTVRADRPMVPMATGGVTADPAPKGPPTFSKASSTRGSSSGGDGGLVRTGRSSGDAVALQRDLDRLTEKKEIILREIDEVQLKFNYAERELAVAARTGQQADIDRISKDKAALDNRFKVAQSELARVDAEIQSKVGALRGAMGGSDPDQVNPGDSLQVIVAEDDSFNGIYKVKTDGNILLPRVGKVAVGGKGITEAEAAIKVLLEETQLNKATVTAEFKGKVSTDLPPTDQTVVIYLAGEFITPGPLKIPEGVQPTLITTIIRSGGITPSGDLTRTKLLRIENGQGAVEEVNVAAILSGNIPPMDIALNPGDIIMIPAFAPVVYVTGNVNKPGTLRLFQDETLTGYAAILRAGGFSRFANLKKCTVVRDLGNGEKMQMPLNVKEIQKGLAPDIVLQGKDIVVVPESFFSF